MNVCNFRVAYCAHIKATHCVSLNNIDPRFVVVVMLSDALCQHYPPRPGLFLSTSTKFLESGDFFS